MKSPPRDLETRELAGHADLGTDEAKLRRACQLNWLTFYRVDNLPPDIGSTVAVTLAQRLRGREF